jgi:trans-aconitate 2-methyltransferase
MDKWNPAQYERFKEQRDQPFYDLFYLVEKKPQIDHVLDLGCGTGSLTQWLHQQLKPKHTLGIDSSDAMLEKARPLQCPGLSFEKLDMSLLPKEPKYDLIISNAAIQWVDDHPSLLKQLKSQLKPGGQLAVQIPSNHDLPSHQIAVQVAKEEPFRTYLNGYFRQSPVLSTEEYALLLYHLGFHTQTVQLKVYLHLLTSAEDVIEWVKGTLLTDYEKRLNPEQYGEFLNRYRELLLKDLRNERPYPFLFKRLFFCGTTSSS